MLYLNPQLVQHNGKNGGGYMDDGDPQQFSRAVNQLRTSTLQRNGEPHFYARADPPGKALVLDSLQNHTPSKAILSVEVPSPEQRPIGKDWV